jgi:cell fate (sporulation/competence/biofilm development) regulator YlbF (YheA/YmcA/DUF963 family)
MAKKTKQSNHEIATEARELAAKLQTLPPTMKLFEAVKALEAAAAELDGK